MKNDSVETNCGVWQLFTIIYITYVQKDFSDSSFYGALIDKISIFHEIPLNFTNIVIFLL